MKGHWANIFPPFESQLILIRTYWEYFIVLDTVLVVREVESTIFFPSRFPAL